jgi:hypothetical protein
MNILEEMQQLVTFLCGTSKKGSKMGYGENFLKRAKNIR